MRGGKGMYFDEMTATVLADNAMLKHKPELYKEWDFNKNINLDIFKVTKGSVIKVSWQCSKCGSCYESRVDSRVRGNNCPYCSKQKVNHTNSLATLNPELASQWHPELNGELTPQNVVCGSERKVWWKCELNHPYECRIADRNKSKGCPYCAGKKVLKGFNDLWTTHPHVAMLLLSSEEGYKYSFGSKKKLHFKCSECNHEVKNKTINKVCVRGLSCPKCSDGYSYPEKFMYGVLTQLNVEFETQKTFTWAKNKKYDFYLPEHNMIIETHGRQHNEQGFQIAGAKTLTEEKENDKLKRDLALANEIKLYVELDCYNSDLNYIKSSILNSIIVNHFDLSKMDWVSISLNANKSLLVEVCNFYRGNNITQKEISQHFKISDSTIRRYLTTGSELGLCEYLPSSKRNKTISVKHMEKKVVQLDLKGNFVNEWDSMRLAGRSLNKESVSSISACCKGKAKTTYGFKWMYKEDYENIIKELNVI